MSSIELEPLARLERDVRRMAADLGPQQARGLVDLYYGLQEFRINASNQNHALTKSEEPHATVEFFFQQFYNLEKDIAKALDTYSAAQPLGVWAREHVGIGPVIAAGLLAHIDITTTPTPSALWKFAGLAPGQRYVKGEKRSWNAGLKVLCWKMGDSFVKQSGRENCYYGKLYLRRKEKEVARNEAVRIVKHVRVDAGVSVATFDVNNNPNWVAINGIVFEGGNAIAAARSLTEKQVRDTELKAVLQSGKLPPGQIDMRARRYAVKRYLVHYWMAAYWLHYGTEPPRAYVLDQLGHVDEEPSPVAMPKPKMK